jgi:hypothetical protein
MATVNNRLLDKLLLAIVSLVASLPYHGFFFQFTMVSSELLNLANIAWILPLGFDFSNFIIFANFRPSSATNSYVRTFTTVADQQSTVQFPVFQGERVNCEDNTSLGEFTLAPIPPMRAG